MSKKPTALNFSINTKTMRDALGKLLLLGSGGTDIASMMVKIEADMEGLTLTRCTPEHQMKLSVEADVSDPGTVAVNCSVLCSIAQRMPQERMEVSLEEKRLVVSSGRSTAKLGALSDEFQERPKIGEPVAAIAGAIEPLISSINACLPAAIRADPSKPACQAVIFRSMDGAVCLIGTDGRAATKCVTDHKGEIDTNIPALCASIICKLATGVSGEMEIDFFENSFTARIGDAEYKGNILESKLANTNLVFAKPDKCTTHEFNRLEMISALDASRATANVDKSVVIKTKKKNIEVISDSRTDGETTTEIPCKSSADHEFKFNSEYFQSCLEHVRDENPTMLVEDFTRMVIFDGSRTFVIMQIRIS